MNLEEFVEDNGEHFSIITWYREGGSEPFSDILDSKGSRFHSFDCWVEQITWRPIWGLSFVCKLLKQKTRTSCVLYTKSTPCRLLKGSKFGPKCIHQFIRNKIISNLIVLSKRDDQKYVGIPYPIAAASSILMKNCPLFTFVGFCHLIFVAFFSPFSIQLLPF